MTETFKKNTEVPLCIDLDRTLIATDLLHESLTRLLTQRPWLIFHAIFWLLQGRAVLKRRLAERIQIDVATLPYNDAVLELARKAQASNRQTVLISASDELLVKKVADITGCFDACSGSNPALNLKGAKKAELLLEKYGKGGFSYAADSISDLPVWREAHEAILVGSQAACLKPLLEGKVPVITTLLLRPTKSTLLTLLRAVRIQQWIKNLLIFVPLVMAHRIFNLPMFLDAAAAFLSFGLTASSVYLLNDIFDLEADRRHRIKKMRPLASGVLPLWAAWVMIPLLGLLGLLIGSQLSAGFLAILLIYLFVTFFYSWFLKRVDVLDIVVLALLYTLRVLAGGYAVDVEVSQALLSFSMFFFLSLACVKRFSELRILRLSREEQCNRRGYQSVDLEQISQFGSASGYIAVLVLALYVSSEEIVKLYARPQLIWLLCPLVLYWISRIWLLAGRGKVHEDPIVFAVRDKVSYFVGALAAFILILAL